MFIKKGNVKVDFYDDGQRCIDTRILEAGDVILLASGGNGFTMLEPTEMIEVKLVPFVGDHDKTRFEGMGG